MTTAIADVIEVENRTSVGDIRVRRVLYDFGKEELQIEVKWNDEWIRCREVLDDRRTQTGWDCSSPPVNPQLMQMKTYD